MNQLTELLMYKALRFKQSSQECSDTILDHLTSNGHEAVSYTHLTLPTSDLV